MSDKPTIAQLQRVIDKMAADSRKALEMAKAVYGADAQLFCDTDCLVVMDGDEDEGVSARTAHVRLHAKGLFPVGGGAF